MLNRLNRTLLAVATAWTLVGCTSTPPVDRAPEGPPHAMLWVGNSFFYYNNSMHGHVSGLVQGGDKSVQHRGVSVTISGSGVDWHDMSSYLTGGIGKYSFLPGNEIKFNPTGRQFDAVMFMDCSQCPIHPQLGSVFHDYAKKNADTIRAYGAQPVLFMSWAYKDKPEMTQQLAAEYQKAGKAVGAKVVPAGLAFANSIQKRPTLDLYVSDLRHPSLAGTYLGAATVYASLLNKSPVGNSYTAGLPADVAAHLQQVAWDTVQAFKP